MFFQIQTREDLGQTRVHWRPQIYFKVTQWGPKNSHKIVICLSMDCRDQAKFNVYLYIYVCIERDNDQAGKGRVIWAIIELPLGIIMPMWLITPLFIFLTGKVRLPVLFPNNTYTWYVNNHDFLGKSHPTQE